MTSGEFWERFGGFTPAQILTTGLRLRDAGSGQDGLAACADISVSCNGSLPTPDLVAGQQTQGEDGAPLP